jgi:hypothetical protein
MNTKMIEIMCGKMDYDPITKKVSPDPSKGKIKLEIVNQSYIIFHTSLFD